MKRIFVFMFTFLCASTLLFVSAAYADRGDTARDINRRIAEMHQRIDQGVKSGEITRMESVRLRAELNKIRDDEARMRRDGRLNKRERDRLNSELDRLSKHIYIEKHDKDKRDRTDSARDINRRIDAMQKRIDRGVRSGEITRLESVKLRAELNKIRDDEARMRRDGRLNKRERERLDSELDRLEKNIYREKHDTQRRRRP